MAIFRDTDLQNTTEGLPSLGVDLTQCPFLLLLRITRTLDEGYNIRDTWIINWNLQFAITLEKPEKKRPCDLTLRPVECESSNDIVRNYLAYRPIK